MRNFKQLVGLLLSLIIFYLLLGFSFQEKAAFWYLYTFSLLVGMAIAIISGTIKDELPTWKYLIYGIGYGTITYGIIRLGSLILTKISDNFTKQLHSFLTSYGPNNIWHYLLLIFIIVVGEELFWRGFVQQKLKHFVPPFISVIITSILFALFLAISGFIPGILAAFVVSLIFGFLYEWKKSIPLIIVSHEVFVLLLFLILPL